ncbi:GSCOCG00005535001-RA-CDS [Cotesia congregata]|uniref:Mitochondrial (Bos taurus) n=1 Tax=Cotesia congregata TaxID=51543 RepID=A0A8J2HFX2_COTCN|nr:GSCOCG00005535001-RA-CDS [Cotesia congregata]CAG5093519.1 Similar to MRPS34: 28S ribosomal protein S34 [Cotesia congregata]
MRYQYIGRTHDFAGKTLWEILGNLKNYGVGRLIIRHRFQSYPEPCYIKILKVAALPNPVVEIRPAFINTLWERTCLVLCERVFRGKKSEQLMQISSASYKTDYQLVPKDEEYKYIDATKPREEVVISRTMEVPPLLREVAIRNLKAKGKPVTEPQMDVILNEFGIKTYRLAKEGEKPTYVPTIGIGKTPSPSLYANCKPI